METRKYQKWDIEGVLRLIKTNNIKNMTELSKKHPGAYNFIKKHPKYNTIKQKLSKNNTNVSWNMEKIQDVIQKNNITTLTMLYKHFIGAYFWLRRNKKLNDIKGHLEAIKIKTINKIIKAYPLIVEINSFKAIKKRIPKLGKLIQDVHVVQDIQKIIRMFAPEREAKVRSMFM